MASRERRRTEAYRIAARNIHRGRARRRRLARLERRNPGVVEELRRLDRWFRRLARAVEEMGSSVEIAAVDACELLRLIEEVPYE